MSPDVAVCGECRAQIPTDLVECPDCGADQGEFDPDERVDRADHRTGEAGRTEKSPALAGVLSVLIIGVGHLYIGKVGRGLALFGGALAVGTALAMGGFGKLWYLLIVVGPILAGVDAYYQADALNEAA